MLVAIAAPIWAIAVYVLYVAWAEHRLATASVPATCTIVARDVDIEYDRERVETDYHPVVTLAHEVGGGRYERKDRGPARSTMQDAFAITSRYATGSTVPCSYVEGHPELVRVFAHGGSRAWGFFAFGLFLLLGTAAMFLYEHRRAAKLGHRRRRLH